MRRTKTVGGVTHNYTYDGLNLIREEWNGNVMIFLYDAAGSVVGMQYRNSSYATGVWDTYYYEKNLQGDVIAIYNASGTKLVSYTYDAWGNFTRTDVASSVPDIVKNNPITYRGYYYDSDLDLYYLSTRYYDPETCRFITADSYVSTGQGILGHNMYAYCGNNPINGFDPTGRDTVSIGLGFFFGVGGGYSSNICASWDSEGMVAIQRTYSVPNDEKTRNTVIGITVGLGISFQYTNLNSVSDLNGPSTYTGFNTPIGSYDLITVGRNNELVGDAFSVGPSIGADFHVNETYTSTIGNPRPSLIKILKDWLGI